MRTPNRLSQRSGGFTIIEVLIVLAIAGLIMVVVFLAVPALQRSSRNNALGADANNILTGIGNYVGNNNGSTPDYTDIILSSDARSVTIGDTSNNQEKVTLGGSVKSLSAGPSATLSLPLPPSAAPGQVEIVLGSKAKCNADATGLDTSSAAPAGTRSYVVLYVAESGSGNILKCIGA